MPMLLLAVLLTSCYRAPPAEYVSVTPTINNSAVTHEPTTKYTESDLYDACVDHAIDKVFKLKNTSG